MHPTTQHHSFLVSRANGRNDPRSKYTVNSKFVSKYIRAYLHLHVYVHALLVCAYIMYTHMVCPDFPLSATVQERTWNKEISVTKGKKGR